MEAGLSKVTVVNMLCRSPHGKLEEYTNVGQRVALEDPMFLAHLTAWNQVKGQVRDAKVALPVLAACSPKSCLDGELFDNALAHLASLDPRNYVRALDYAKTLRGRPSHQLKKLTTRYLRWREAQPRMMERAMLQHRASLRTLYARHGIKPAPHVQQVLFDGAKPGVFGVVAALPNMEPRAAAAAILRHKLPFLVATSALGAKAKDPTLVMAMLEQMSAAEVTNNSAMLTKLGVKTDPALRAAYQAALDRVVSSDTVASFKAAKAASVVGDEKIAAKLAKVSEEKLDQIAVEGNWLVLVDKSGSMHHAIAAGRVIAAQIARLGKGRVWLVFFDSTPYGVEVTGKTLEEIEHLTRNVSAGGGTQIGCGVQLAVDQGWPVDGIAIVSDGGENFGGGMCFHQRYPVLCASLGKEPAVYHYHLPGDPNRLADLCSTAGIEVTGFDIVGTDYYSVPNLVQTMRTSRYGLVQEVMDTPLLTCDEVFAKPRRAA